MIGEGRTAYWVGELGYSYSVDGDYYSGFRYLPVSGGDQASRSVQGWKDRRVEVHYSPSNPAQSVLVIEEQDQPSATIITDISPH